MSPREGEPAIFLDVPRISEKTSNEMLKKWSSKIWPSDGRNSVARDIVSNGKELLLGNNVDWNQVLPMISARKMDIVVFGEDAIAADGARFIGGLAAHAGWSMHDPPSVYLSGKYLGHIAGSRLEDFRTAMTKKAVSYGQKTLPEAELLMKTLDLLLEHPNKRNHRNLLTKITKLLHDGKIQGAYNIVSSLEHPVSRRGPVFSKTTTSSILTPPKPGI